MPAKRLALMGLTGALLLLAGRSFEPFGSRAETRLQPGAGGVPLGESFGPEFRLVVHTSERGPVYTVVSRDGAVLASGLTRAEVLARFPGVHLETMTADTPEPSRAGHDW